MWWMQMLERPVPGSQYSFKKQKEFDIIMKNLKYDKEKKLFQANNKTVLCLKLFYKDRNNYFIGRKIHE